MYEDQILLVPDEKSKFKPPVSANVERVLDFPTLRKKGIQPIPQRSVQSWNGMRELNFSLA